MTLLASFTKQPREKGMVQIGYANLIAGRVVDSMSLALEVPTGMTSAGYVISGSNMQFHYAGGSDMTGYRFTAVMTLIIGGFPIVAEDEIDIVVLAI